MPGKEACCFKAEPIKGIVNYSEYSSCSQPFTTCSYSIWMKLQRWLLAIILAQGLFFLIGIKIVPARMLSFEQKEDVAVFPIQDSKHDIFDLYKTKYDRLEFIHITKNAGTSIESIGAKHGLKWGACHWKKIKGFGPACSSKDILMGKLSNSNRWYVPDRLPLPIPTNKKGRHFLVGETWHTPHYWFKKVIHPNAATFCIVRNPYERLLSEYHCKYGGYKGKDKDDPEVMNKYLRIRARRSTKFMRTHYMRQSWYVFDKHGKQRIHHVLRFEHLNEDFHRLMKLYGLDDVELPPKKNSRKGGGSESLTVANLTDDTIQVINECYQDDFVNFRYKMIKSADEYESSY